MITCRVLFFFVSVARSWISFSAKGQPQCRTKATRVGDPLGKVMGPRALGAGPLMSGREDTVGALKVGIMDCSAGR